MTSLQSRRVLYVGGLEDSVQEPTLRAAMIPFGPIQSIDIPLDYAKGIHKGFAFVEYQDADDAAEAMFNMDGAELCGKTLSVSLAQANQLRGNNNNSRHTAVWNSDEWFQQQQQQQNESAIQSDAAKAQQESERRDVNQLQQVI